jgi:hypothetical protein
MKRDQRKGIEMKNVIHTAADRTYLVRTSQSAWYDHSFVIYPFTGTFNAGKMHDALRKKFGRASYGKFGGGESIGKIELVGPGWIEVEHIYHIGD